MLIVNCRPIQDLLFYNVQETLTVIVRNVYLFYVSFAGLGLGLGTAGFDCNTNYSIDSINVFSS